MPSWSIHLKVGKELNKKLNIDNDLFMFGSLIPDTDKDWNKHRFEAHYYGILKYPKCPKENMIDLNLFLTDYKNKLNNPMIVGYYCHILTDYFYNEYIYYNKWVQDENNEIVGIKKKDGTIIDLKENFRDSLKYKHNDLELYGKRIFNNEELIFPKYNDKFVESIELLKDNFITIDNVKFRINYLNNEFKDFNKISEEELNKDYELFTKEELEKLLNDCIEYIEDNLIEVGVLNER